MLTQNNATPLPPQNLEAYGALLEVDGQEKRIKARQGYMKAYIVSFLFPPMGVFYLVKYLFFAEGTTEDVKAGVIALSLTVASIVVSIWSFAALFGQLNTGASGQSLDLLQKQATPENIKEMLKLYQ